jgi:hypothetical protein
MVRFVPFLFLRQTATSPFFFASSWHVLTDLLNICYGSPLERVRLARMPTLLNINHTIPPKMKGKIGQDGTQQTGQDH